MASKGINKVIIVGNLGKDPEVRYNPNGKAMANITVATSESWKDQQGQLQEKTEWHRISVFGKLAEIAGEYLRKGSQVYFEGKLQTRKWQDQQGQDKYTTEIVIDPFKGVMQMLGSRAAGQGQNQSAPQQNQPQNSNQGQSQPAQPQQTGGAPQQPGGPGAEPDFDFDDDIPFLQAIEYQGVFDNPDCFEEPNPDLLALAEDSPNQ